jgi:small subunit ribosomal protein S16
MALVIRMRQQGRKNRQTFRLVVVDKKTPRDGKYLESVGSYDPHCSTTNFKVDGERLLYWVNHGAQISKNAQSLVKKFSSDVIEQVQSLKNAARTKKTTQKRLLRKKKAEAKKRNAT